MYDVKIQIINIHKIYKTINKTEIIFVARKLKINLNWIKGDTMLFRNNNLILKKPRFTK